MFTQNLASARLEHKRAATREAEVLAQSVADKQQLIGEHQEQQKVAYAEKQRLAEYHLGQQEIFAVRLLLEEVALEKLKAAATRDCVPEHWAPQALSTTHTCKVLWSADGECAWTLEFSSNTEFESALQGFQV